VAHALELATCPPNDIGIVEMAVVGDPAADARVVQRGQLGQGFVTAMMKRPASDWPRAGARDRALKLCYL
jgi:hypothetical protein